VDLEFDSPSGVTSNLDVQPTVQLSFSYMCIVPIPDSSAYQVQRRLRVETLRVDIARMPLDLYSAADAKVIAALLCHKIVLSMQTVYIYIYVYVYVYIDIAPPPARPIYIYTHTHTCIYMYIYTCIHT